MNQQRDYIGYGKTPPKVEWPNGARIAVNVVLNYETGAELTPMDGEERETLGEFGVGIPPNERNPANESRYEYGPRAGVWRVLRMWQEYGIQGTIYACGRAIERNPAAAREFTALGHDIVGHGYRWVEHYGMDPDFEQDEVRRAVTAIQETSGYRIRGWFTRFLESSSTKRILLDEGFTFDCNSWADDLPYFVDVDGRPLLMVPYTEDNNDFRFIRGSFLTGRDFFEYLKDGFDVLYKEGATHPRMMSVGLHDRIIGRPGPSRGLEMFLEYARGLPDVWFARRTDLADWWIEKYGPGSRWRLRQ